MDSSRAVTSAEENEILLRVYRTLHDRDADQFRCGERWRPGGVLDLQEQLLRVIRERWRVVLRNPDARPSPADLCANCFYRTPYGYCPHYCGCVLHEHADLIGRTISESLMELTSSMT